MSTAIPRTGSGARPSHWLYTDDFLEIVDKWSGVVAEPSRENRKITGIRVFRNGFVEHGLSKAHPIVPILWVTPVVIFGLHRGIIGGKSGVPGTLGLFLAGILLWTLLEYLLHRFLFHLVPKGDTGKVWAFMMHGYHHEFPDDRLRLLAPPLMSWTFATVVAIVYFFIFGADLWFQVFAGTAAGYLIYDSVHLYAHHSRPKSRVGKWIRRYHLMHHFDDEHNRYGISSPLWDLVFRTYRPLSRA